MEGRGIGQYLKAVADNRIESGWCLAAGENLVFFYDIGEGGWLSFNDKEYVPPDNHIRDETIPWSTMERRPTCADFCQKRA